MEARRFLILIFFALICELLIISPVMGDTISMTADKDTIYFGDTITFSGSNFASDMVYLFITGTNLPACGGLLTYPRYNIINYISSTFTQANISENNTWEYKWHTANLSIDPGTYTIYAVATPNDKNNLLFTQYATQSIVILADNRVYPDMPDNTAGEEIPPDEQPSIAIPGEGIDIVSDLDNGVAYIGDAITLSGSNLNSDTVFLFVTGPNLPANGGRITGPMTAVIDNNPVSFNNYDVLDDHTWEYNWQTANINIDPGTYTIYAVSTPNSKNNLTNTQYATLSVSIRKPFLTASLSQDTVAAGENVFVQGIATGNPSPGVAIWIVGTNYCLYSTVSVNSDGTFEKEITEGTTENMANGKYSIIVQHPMHNWRFDIYPRADAGYPYRYVVGPYPIAGAENVFFTITGPGSLTSLSTINALLNDLNNPNIDDCYTRLELIVGEPSSPPLSGDYLSATVQPSVASQGGAMSIQGSAQGNPAEGIAIWIMGNDNIIYDIVQVNPDSSFEYEVPIFTLPDGEYSVVVQHPMYNKKFDIYPRADAGYPYRYVVGPYPIAGAENVFFTLDGPGSLSSSSAVEALIHDLDNPNTDDIYTELTFTIGSASSPPAEEEYLSVNILPSDIAQGQNIAITGSAKGTPNEGVAIWIIGKNFIFHDIANVEPDTTFGYDLSSDITQDLANGEYTVFVQHPMYNNKFDIYPRADAGYPYRYVVGPYPIPHAENAVFMLDGPGSLLSSSAVKALLFDLENPNIDDEYKRATFVVGDSAPYPSITSLNPSSITAGSDAFTLQITGTNFVDGATALWDGEERDTEYVSSTELTATIIESDIVNSGTFKIKVGNPDGNGSNEVNFTVQSDSSVIAEFTASVASGPVPLQVTFFDQSDGNPESWFWEFGDGGVSNEQNPSHTYNSIGEYTVNLTINSEGFQNTDSKYQFICVVNDVTGDYLRIEQAAQWASDRVGPTAEYADHSLRFINAAYNNGSNAQIDIGIDTYEDLVSAISRLNQNTTPPRGAYVFYSESPSPAVALSLGDGDIIHVTADVVEITQYLDHPGYAGWSWPPISAPVILYPLNGSVVDETPEIVLKNSIWTDRDSSEQYEIVVEDVDLPVLGSVKSSTKSAKSINTASLIDAFNGICKSLFDPLTDGWKKIRIFRINNDGERISETHTVINVESTKKTLQEKAVELAKTVVGAPYQLGAKGYNLSGNQPAYDGRYVEAEEIKKNGYHWDWDDYSIKSAGIDCSGLIFWSYNKASGVTKYLDPNNPTHPSDQWEKDIDPDRKFTYNNIPGQISKEPPTANDLQTGDLLFILVHSKPPGIGYMHVGMYAGNGEVIHSSGEGGVEIIKLEDWFDLGIGGTSYSYWDYFTGYGSISTESALQPKLVTDKVGQIDSSSAILKGHIENPEPGQTYTVCFRYEGGSTPKTKVGCTTVTSAKPSYEYTLMGLEPATTYYYRAVHTDSQGVGDDEKHPIDANNVESFSTSTTSQINTARVPEELLEKIDNYIEENPNFYYYDENWEISKDQYKLMITTLAWSEGNKAGYQAHSSDSYDRWHTELPMSAEGFHFSRGLGPFQITLGDIASKGMYPDIGRPWSNWKTIEKLNSTYALNSTLYRHKNTEKITNPEDIKDLESLRLTMIDDWYGYQYPTLGDWKTKWSEVTGTNWDNVKNSNESGDFLNGYQTSWSDIKTRLINNEKDNPWMSEDEAIKNIGTQKWIIQDEDNVVSATGTKVIIDDYLPTWRISSWKTEGTPLKCDYYYTCDERYGVEIWALAKDPRYIFTRTYTKDNPKDLTYYEFGAHSPDNSGLLLNHEPIIVEEEPEFSNVDVALIIDSSGSMTSTDPTNLRKEAAKLFIDLVDDEDKIAIVDFDENVRVWQSLIGIAGNKAALKTAVDRIDSSGSTNIGGGLRYGYNELNGAQADTTHNKAAILLTDGQHNTGTAPLSVVPDYEAKGWPIYSIALSSDADKQLLNQISDETDGQFYDAPESKALQDIYNKISLRIKGNSQVDVQTGQIREGQTVAGSVPIDSSVKAFNIVLTWPGSDLDLVLYNPDGSPVVLNQSSLSGTDNPDITYIAQNTYEIYKIQHPQPGTWRYDIIGIDVQNQEDYTLTLSASTTIRLDAVTNKQDYSLGEDVQITAELSDEYGGISGAYVTANVTTPDLSHEIIQISDYDNGIYHGIFLNTTQKGHYSIMVEAQKDDIIRQKQIEFEINMTLEPLPIANFTSNTTLGQIPLSIQFIDMSTGSITSRHWSFGDGTFAENVTEVTHTYTTPGNYTVTLTVSGPDGEDSTSQVVQVTDDTIAKEFSVQLNGGWNIFSTPVKLEPGKSTFQEIFSPTEQQKIQVVLGWDEGYWFIPGPTTHVDPLYAYFIKIEDDTTATAILVPSETVTALPSRQLTEGINLIGPAPAYDENSQVFQTMPVDQGLVSIENVGDLTGYVIVVSPHLNQPGWAYAKGGQVKDLLPFKGYWVTMENGPDTMYGFSTTPM